jgi:hypothetical protein
MVVHQESAHACIHQQNGKVEKVVNRTLQDEARCMLDTAACRHQEYWGDSLLTSNYVRNVSCVSNLSCTPYEMFYGKKPDITHLRIFGSKMLCSHSKT